jgi:hypothetical protein
MVMCSLTIILAAAAMFAGMNARLASCAGDFVGLRDAPDQPDL